MRNVIIKFCAKVTLMLLTIVVIAFNRSALASERTLWVSSSEGIFSIRLNKETGRLSKKTLVVEKSEYGFGFLTKHPSKSILYVLSADGTQSSQLNAFRIDSSTSLTLINSITELPVGAAHLQISPQGNTLAVAYYGAGMTGIYSISNGGSLNSTILEYQHVGSSIHKKRQRKPHPHGSVFDASGEVVYVTDLGTDDLWQYKVTNNTDAALTDRVKIPDGFGPRHIIFDAKYEYAYVTNELVGGVSVLKRNAKGILEIIQNVPQVNQASLEPWANVSDVQIHPSGKFLYVLNRGFDQATVYSINPVTGHLRFIENEPVRGSIARHSVIDASGQWMLIIGSASHTLAVFKINENGTLEYTRNIESIPKPLSVVVQ